MARFKVTDSRLYFSQVFVKIVHPHPYVCPAGCGGAGRPPGPPVAVGLFLMIPTPTKSTPYIPNLKSKFQNCEN